MMSHANNDATRVELLMLNYRSKWLGLTLMGASVLTALISGMLAFRGIISADNVFTVFAWCFLLLFVPGFILHVIVIRRQWKQKRYRTMGRNNRL